MSERERIANSGRLIVELARLTNCSGAMVRKSLYDAGFERSVLPSEQLATELTLEMPERHIETSRLRQTVVFHAINLKFSDNSRGYVALTWHPYTSLLRHKVVPQLLSNDYSKILTRALKDGIVKISKILDAVSNDQENKRYAKELKKAKENVDETEVQVCRSRGHVRPPPSGLIDNVIVVDRLDEDERDIQLEIDDIPGACLETWPVLLDSQTIEERWLPCRDIYKTLEEAVGIHNNKPVMFDSSAGKLDSPIPSPRMLARIEQNKGRRSASVTREIPHGKTKPVPSLWERPSNK